MTVAELKVPVLGPEVLAKADGPCPGCLVPIVAGDSYIRKAGAAGFMHSICAANYVRVLEEHEIDGAEGDASGEGN